jgi:hypothetical protein
MPRMAFWQPTLRAVTIQMFFCARFGSKTKGENRLEKGLLFVFRISPARVPTLTEIYDILRVHSTGSRRRVIESLRFSDDN